MLPCFRIVYIKNKKPPSRLRPLFQIIVAILMSDGLLGQVGDITTFHYVQETCLGNSERQILQIHHSWSIGLLPLAVEFLGEIFGAQISSNNFVDPSLAGFLQGSLAQKNGRVL